ncbi:hypothetical protein SAMN05216593_102199 [Pseudomonas asturiensis]|uniref:Uncharacterized protein n=1 Tax=Pseudomonas asturiensis TaxID=1190415 RepID=A0A1M7KKR7_9PSED|nr:hypothetical protein SAMN05216593_102199 [Pseudomonas asturiensis]
MRSYFERIDLSADPMTGADISLQLYKKPSKAGMSQTTRT